MKKDSSKVCCQCKLLKPMEEFAIEKRASTGRSSACKGCVNKRRRENRQLNAPKKRSSDLKYNYGITSVDYDILLEIQGGVCAICSNINRGSKPLSVDHDHLTLEIRGLLCVNCNFAIGSMHDNPVLLRKAASYLEGN